MQTQDHNNIKQISKPVHVYIDGANWEKGVKNISEKFDQKRFYIWLKEKHKATSIYLFMGYLPTLKKKYEILKNIGYKIIFKETYKTQENKIKGNCDAELILQAITDFV